MTSKYWMWTLHKEVEGPNKDLARVWSPARTFENPPENLRFVVCQLEMGEQTNKTHYQGFLITHNSIRMNQVKTYLQAPWVNVFPKPADAVEDIIKYCMKEETRVEGAEPFILGEPPKASNKGKRNDLLNVHDAIINNKSLYEIANSNPLSFLRYTNNIRSVHSMFLGQRAQTVLRDISVEVLIGPPGVGKTQYACLKNGLENCYILNTSAGQTVWWDNYLGQKCIILDDFYGTGLNWHMFLRILDKYPLQLQIKGSTTWAQFTKVIITSNRDWYQWYPGQIKGSQWKNQIGALYRRFSKILIFKSRDSSNTLKILQEEIIRENGQPVLPAYLTEAKANLQEDGTWPEDYRPSYREQGLIDHIVPDDYVVPRPIGEIRDEDISDAETLHSEEMSEEESESDADTFIVSESGDDAESDEDIIIVNNKRRRL